MAQLVQAASLKDLNGCLLYKMFRSMSIRISFQTPSSGRQFCPVGETHLDGIGGEVQDAERRRLWEGVRVQRRDQVVAQVQD